MEELTLSGEFMPLCDLLKRVGWLPSGGQAKMVIADGLVKVDGKVELRKRCKIHSGQIIEFEGQKLKVVFEG